MLHPVFRSISVDISTSPVRQIATGLMLSLLLVSSSVFSQSTISSQTVHFQVVPDQSVLRVMVGRGGLLARLGHNHVIVNRSLSGEIMLDNLPERSYARIRMPIEGLIVDEPAERKRAGSGYESVPDDKARTDTHTNMLRPEVLDGQRWPEIMFEVKFMDVDSNPPVFDVMLTFKGATIPLRLPAQLSVSDNRLEVMASFSLDHHDLGLRPFSALGGALKVAETIGFELTVVAEKVEARTLP